MATILQAAFKMYFLKWKSVKLYPFDDNWALFETMAWHEQTRSHYVKHCWLILLTDMSSLDLKQLLPLVTRYKSFSQCIRKAWLTGSLTWNVYKTIFPLFASNRISHAQHCHQQTFSVACCHTVTGLPVNKITLGLHNINMQSDN